jgi:hypothetical protein
MFNKTQILGHPYHGLVQDGQLTLSNNQHISYPGLTNGDTQLIAIPGYPTPVRTVEEQVRDRANGCDWLNYALVTDNHLGGVDLGMGWLLYVDANRVVWYLKIGYEISDKQCRMSCTLQGAFGRFNGNYANVTRPLVQATTTLLSPGSLKATNRFTFERKSDGSEVLIHVYADLSSGNVIDIPEPMSLYEIWKLQLNGEGQLIEDQSLGLGISANLTIYKSFPEIQDKSQQTLIRQDNSYRLGKVNIVEKYDPKPVEPPECATNTFRQTFDLALIPLGQDFTPFSLDRNVYTQTNWFGQTESKTAIARMLYDASGNIHTLSVKQESKRLSRFFQTLSGSGTATQGPLQYWFLNNVCVPNGDAPAFVEEYHGTQYVEVVSRVSNEKSLLLDDGLIETLSLAGETSQKATTVIGQQVVNEVNVTVKINNETVRNVTKQPGQIPNSILSNPFAGEFSEDDSYGVYAKFYFGLLSNNLAGQFMDRLVSSDLPSVTQKESHAVAGPNVVDITIRINPAQFYRQGSFNPILKKLTRYQNEVQAWS